MKKSGNITALLLLLAGLAVFVTSVLSIPLENRINPPDGYKKVQEATLKEAHSNYGFYEFHLDRKQTVGFHIWCSSGSSKSLVVTGPGNTQVELIGGESKISSSEFTLEAGEYKILLTNQSASGQLLLFMKLQPGTGSETGK